MDPSQNPILAPLDPATIARHERTKRELERRKLDRCKVYNFTDKDFTIIYDGYANTVPTHTEAVFFRYIAEPFAIQLVDKYLMDLAEDEVKKVNADRASLGLSKVMRMEKNEIYANPEFSILNINVRRPLMRQAWKGVVEEFGMNNVVEQKQIKQQDTRPVDEQLFEEIDKENLVSAESPQASIVAPVNTPPAEVPPAVQVPVSSETPMEDLPTV